MIVDTERFQLAYELAQVQAMILVSVSVPTLEYLMEQRDALESRIQILDALTA